MVFIIVESNIETAQKAKELFAYLIDRGGSFCTNGELIGVLWEDRVMSHSLSSQLRTLEADLIHAFRGYANIFVKKRGMIRVIPEKVNCDYFRWLSGDVEMIRAYNGEYMSQYSWAEFTRGYMEI